MLPLIYMLILAAAPAQDPIVGTWEGTSLCQAKPSPCHDEHVVYRFTPTGPARYKLDAYKVVGGKELFMGPMNITFESALGELQGTIAGSSARGTSHVRLKLQSNRLTGQLLLGDGTLYRLIEVTKR